VLRKDIKYNERLEFKEEGDYVIIRIILFSKEGYTEDKNPKNDI
jgi:hypothetical protein